MGTFCESSTKVKYVPPSDEEVLAKESRVKEDLQALTAFYPEKDGTKKRICHICGCHFRVTYFDLETGRIPLSVFIKFEGGKVTEYEEPKK